ncbi:multicopper oxidase domain-containing protein [Actinomarinicola tropica]|uniref:Multicopper oxidase domain-containing protein n=1 Tax=Actinomarinicola tropica TaxID=2789776 RepID=A0A5Q2RHW9_9ACTN|nr:multicopper oxidase domain-containing protein [Actinomarinicola tropica]QGG96468.1 multicopper oxidase domain-containing protein [Actinomarinicola tropica]
MATPRPERLNAFSIFAALAGLAGFALAALAVIVVTVKDDGVGASAVGAATAEMTHVSVSLSEFTIDMPTEIPAGAMLDVTNAGSAVHNLAVKDTDLTTPDLNAGETAMLDTSALAPGDYTVVCTIAGHEAAGMVLDITISESATVPVAADGGEAAGGHGSDGAEMTEEEADRLDELMMASMNAFPAETEGVGNLPLEPVEVDGDVKVFELEASIIEWEVEPGKFVDAWAYNGQVPAPWIDLEVGDTARFVVTNNTPLGTDVHWHGITVPNDQDGVAPYTQEIIKSGETYTYEFTVVEEMVGMYHAHAHSQVSVPNGMFGAFTVGDVDLPLGRTINDVTIPEQIDLALEMPMVLNDAGVIGYSLNGKSFPATAPIVLEEGDWFLMHYLNEGLQSHPMHLHGVRQLVVAKDGIPLAEPYWVDTLNVAPGERYSVLVHASEPGTWVFHCHILSHVEKEDGMFGMVTAMVVNEA